MTQVLGSSAPVFTTVSTVDFTVTFLEHSGCHRNEIQFSTPGILHTCELPRQCQSYWSENHTEQPWSMFAQSA